MPLEVLLGLQEQEPLVARVYQRFFVRKGYRVTLVTTVDAMLQSIQDHGQYDVYLMDANLGAPGDDSPKEAEHVYKQVKESVDAGRATFMAISGNQICVDQAKAAGIPCLLKAADMTEYFSRF